MEKAHVAATTAPSIAAQGISLSDEFKRKNCWGIATSVDLYNCDPVTIRDADKIRQFVVELCDLIEMKRFGECIVVNFGEDERVEGYSAYQLIETSNIGAHFSNFDNSTYLDIFSCKYYVPEVAVEFAKAFFNAKDAKFTVILRGVRSL